MITMSVPHRIQGHRKIVWYDQDGNVVDREVAMASARQAAMQEESDDPALTVQTCNSSCDKMGDTLWMWVSNDTRTLSSRGRPGFWDGRPLGGRPRTPQI